MQTCFDLSAASINAETLPLQQGDVRYYSNWLSLPQADQLFIALQTELNWRQDSIKLFGKSLLIPRLQAWYGDSHCQYAYSGLSLQPTQFTENLAALAKQLQVLLSARFNCVLCNWYRDGSDSMSMHADDEPELGDKPIIASVTLGGERNFDFKHKSEAEKYRIRLQHGSLLVMAGDTQRHYVHGINKTKRFVEPRINLTYRYIAANYER